MDIIGCNNCGGKRPAFKRFPNVVDPMTGKHYHVDTCPECWPILKPFIGRALQNGASANGATPKVTPPAFTVVADVDTARLKRNAKQRQYRATHPRADRKRKHASNLATPESTPKRHYMRHPPAIPGETARERKMRLDRERYHVRARAAGVKPRDALAQPVTLPALKRGRPPKHMTKEEAHERKLQKQRLRRQAGWGNDMHLLRDGSRVLLKGPPYKCSCGIGEKGKPGGFKLFRGLMRHANKQAKLGHGVAHVVGKPVPA